MPAIHRLETAFGGGKTHTLIALAHLACHGSDLAAIAKEMFLPDIFDPARWRAPGAFTLVGVAGDEIPVHRSQGAALIPYTRWGEMAYQILDLLDVWAREMDDETLRREAEVLHFGLRSSGS